MSDESILKKAASVMFEALVDDFDRNQQLIGELSAQLEKARTADTHLHAQITVVCGLLGWEPDLAADAYRRQKTFG